VQDGVPNLLKYALGYSPRLPAVLPLPGEALVTGSNYLTLTFGKPIGLTDITYNVQVSPDMQAWSAGAVRLDNGTTDTAVYRDAVPLTSGSHRFMRLNITRP
jgi:hypothetical protein